jgi:hypothetical protein
MNSYLEIFTRAAATARPLLVAHDLTAHVGCWHDSAVLKVQKSRWTNASALNEPADAGIFFSIWIEAESLKKKQAFYNIHALELRALEGFLIQSRDFAAAFRAAFADSAHKWPHVSTDYGPQTLMQGWIALDLPRFETDIALLIERFLPLTTVIDGLLDSRTAAHRSAGRVSPAR